MQNLARVAGARERWLPAPAANDSSDDPIQALWDDMIEFHASGIDEALDHLMTRLCELIGADNAVFVCAVRLPDTVPYDTLRGWRAHQIRHLHPLPPEAEAKVQAVRRNLDGGAINTAIVRLASGAGSWRANRLVDLLDPNWFASDEYRDYFLDTGVCDAMWASCPLNAETEVHCGLKRGAVRPAFTAEERDTLLAATRGLKWFFRRVLLAHGLSIASAPLTPVERAVLQGLLSGQSEKQIAAAQGQSPHTTHDHVKAIYRKFGVGNRATLMALWLGKSV